MTKRRAKGLNSFQKSKLCDDKEGEIVKIFFFNVLVMILTRRNNHKEKFDKMSKTIGTK